MGNYRFRLSDMMPNAWFYKLKDMAKSSSRRHSHTTSSSSSSNLQLDKKRQPHNFGCQRKSYYISRNLTITSPISSNSPKLDHNVHITEPSRKSYKKRRSTNFRRRNSPKPVNSSASVESVWTKPDSTPEQYPNSSSSSSSSSPSSILPQKSNPITSSISPSCDCRTDSTNQNSANLESGVHSVSKIDLPRIITKPEKFDEKIQEKQRTVKQEQRIVKQEQRIVRRVSTNGVKLRTNSPRITTTNSRKSVSSKRTSVTTDSFAVVKSSRNPQKDFRESMVEMIIENNITTSKDLEELLACYLSLNSDEYHDIIIKVFKQIWFNITEIRLK
ncbi:hypothetical protein EJD97_011936 [Solanum chilense]|uniref:Transcription repressor n=1 Tax=Solanum chilense TaxID=4083 RepID=A0A6N2AF43_SOLCI|nr:hypothetical protein EJD97_011936 [Solanum chilense]